MPFSRTITIDHTKVPNTDQTNFPVLFSGTYSYLATTANGGKVESASGYDILFYSDSGLTSLLDFEIDTWNATTGAISAWIRIPTLSTTVDTVIYLYYGDVTIVASQQNVDGTWNANFLGVWHLPDGTTLSANDSSGGGNNGTINGTVSAIAAQISGGASFPGTATNYISTPSQNPTSITISAWAKPAAASNAFVVNKNFASSVVPYQLLLGGGNAGVLKGMGFYSGGWHASGITTDIRGTLTVRHVVGTYDGTTLKFYVDGALDKSTAYTGSLPSNAATADIGRYGNDGHYFNGIIDEVHIANTAFSADWIATEFNNQDSPSTFYNVSGETVLGSVTLTLGTADLTTDALLAGIRMRSSNAGTGGLGLCR